MVSSQQLMHHYVTREEQLNPDLPLLRDEADRREHEERRREHRYEEARNELRRAEHRIPQDAPNREQTLRELRRQADRAEGDYKDARDRAWRARRDLRMASPTVTVQRSLSWPYVKRQMRKTLAVSAVATMKFGEQSVTDATNFSQTATSEDTVIDHANPALGLAADDLSLASDAALKAGAGPALAEELASWAWSVAREAWASQLASGAEDLERQGKNDDAMELRMAAEAHRAPQGK
jgi:hypothetical protein